MRPGIFLVRSVAVLLTSIVLASVLVFAALSVLGGDAATALLGDQATPDRVQALRRELGLDVPAWRQYLAWVGGVLRGSLGTSYVTGTDVADEILQRLPVTLPLAVLASVGASALALPVGILAALRHRDWIGVGLSALTQVGISIPQFWLALMLALFFAVQLQWLPSGGFVPWREDPIASMRSLALPVFSLAVVLAATLARYVRSAILEVMREDFIRTARAKGLSLRGALWRHGVRNIAVPLITVLGIQFGVLLGGAIIVENVFFIPGLGRMLLQAVERRDLILVQGTVMVLTAFVLVINFLIDVAYGLIDPRMRDSREYR